VTMGVDMVVSSRLGSVEVRVRVGIVGIGTVLNGSGCSLE